ncbi:unnamed protein product, partial [Adineta steineri]
SEWSTWDGLDSATTILFGENLDVVDLDLSIPCPFTNGMIHPIQCCPTQA